MAKSGYSPTQLFTSALPPKADIEMGAALRLLLTLSGHSLDYAVQQVGVEKPVNCVPS